MARSKITSASKDLLTDNGAVLASIIDGEQVHLEVTLNWLINLTDNTLKPNVVEALNLGDGKIPLVVRPAGQVTTLTILDPVVTDNTFKIVFPEELITTWTVQPTPEYPVYGYLELEVRDPGVGSAKQIWKPIRGLVQVLYSPTEV